MKYTEGPWKYRRNATDSGFYIETVNQSHYKTFIGDVGGGLQPKPEIEANAKLIAAAPCLLIALIALKDEVAKRCSIGSDPEFADLLDRWQDAMTAIKKATI